MIGNLFLRAANWRAVKLYFLSMGLFILKFGCFKISVSCSISSKVRALKAMYYKECGYTLLYFVHQATLEGDRVMLKQ
jgi:hypothetical protein